MASLAAVSSNLVVPGSSLGQTSTLHPVTDAVAQQRRLKFQEAFSYFTDFYCSPRITVLKAVCELDIDQFPFQPKDLKPKEKRWTPQHIPGLPEDLYSFYVARQDQMLEIIIPTWKLGGAQKSAWQAVRVFFSKDDPTSVAVTPVFTSQSSLVDLHQSYAVEQELTLRLRCNQFTKFPRLFHYGAIKSWSILMTVEEFFPSDLEDFISSHPAILENERWVVEILIDILEPLVDLHKAGFVHADLKKANILIGSDKNSAVLTDLGLTVKSGAVTDVRGTPLDVGPEMVQEWVMGWTWKIKYIPQVDMWGFGKIAEDLLRKILNRQTSNYLKSQYDIMHAFHVDTNSALARKQFPAWKKDAQDFADSFKNNGHPLEAWLGSIMKVEPIERLPSQVALEQLKAYHLTLTTPSLKLAEIEKMLVPTSVVESSPLIAQTHMNEEELASFKERERKIANLITEFEDNILNHAVVLEAPPPMSMYATLLKMASSWAQSIRNLSYSKKQ